MSVVPDNSLEKIQSLGHIEQSVSIDSRVSRKKPQDQQQKHKKKKFQPTIEEQLEEEEEIRNSRDDEHIDFHA
jgi:hypothetical protein